MVKYDEYDITAAFKVIEEELIHSMIYNMERHKAEEEKEGIQWTQWQVEQLKSLERYKVENQKKYSKQFHELNKRISVLLETANSDGSMEQEAKILEAIKNGFKGYREASKTMQAEFFMLNERKLEALIKATTDDMKKAETAILRMANDKYRSVIFNAQVYANTGAGTYEKAVDMATKDMLASGLNCVEYANGSRHRLEEYADMALRTASKRAYLQGEGTKRQEWGVSLVIMNKRGNPCPKCLPWVGKVLIDDVWSGGKQEDGDYPLMSYAIEKGLYHPRCKDGHTTYFKGISTTEDTWTEEELKKIGLSAKKEARMQYAARQAGKYKRLADNLLDEESRAFYESKTKEWKSIADGLTMDLNDGRLSEEDIYNIHRYMSFESYLVNEKLRNMEPLPKTEQEFVLGLDIAISKLDDFVGEVYRSVDTELMQDEEVFNAKHQPGNIIFYHAYTSASKEIYDEEMKYQLIIRSKRGKDISGINVNEKEILFKRGSAFVVTERKGNVIYLEEI